jgi:hypothetical protein
MTAEDQVCFPGVHWPNDATQHIFSRSRSYASPSRCPQRLLTIFSKVDNGRQEIIRHSIDPPQNRAATWRRPIVMLDREYDKQVPVDRFTARYIVKRETFLLRILPPFLLSTGLRTDY